MLTKHKTLYFEKFEPKFTKVSGNAPAEGTIPDEPRFWTSTMSRHALRGVCLRAYRCAAEPGLVLQAGRHGHLGVIAGLAKFGQEKHPEMQPSLVLIRRLYFLQLTHL